MKRRAVRPGAMLACGLLMLAGASVTEAVPIRTLAGLVSVTTYEQTFATSPVAFAPNSSQLTTRLGDPLSAANNDFTFFDQEFYDVFYSNADGTPNADGAFVTVEGVWRNQAIGFGGMNINEVELNFAGPVNDFADFVSSFVFGSLCTANPLQCSPGSEALAVDQNLGTFPRFGHTSNTDLNERFRLTVGFSGISDVAPPAVPEPSTLLLLGAGAVALIARRRRTDA